jgi:Cu/Ag efflux protein CusF
MKKAIAIVLSIMFVFALTSATFAAEKKAGKAMQVTGEVTNIDAKANTLTVKGKKGDVAISVDDKTAIMAGKEKKSLADVKVGDKVKVMYSDADGKMMAKSVHMMGAKKMEKMEKKAEKKEAAPMAPAPEKKAPEKKKAAGY